MSSTGSTEQPVPEGKGPTPAQRELIEKLQHAKMQTQKAFGAGDFPNSIKFGAVALDLARMLPPPARMPEVVQIHLNLGSAHMQMKNIPEALKHSEASVHEANIAVNESKGKPEHPQAVEILIVALSQRAFHLLSLNDAAKLPVATKDAEMALQLAEMLYPKNDQRLHKCLRGVGMMRMKQGKPDEAEKLFFRAYTLLCIGSAGPACGEAQTLVDDLVNLSIQQKKDVSVAERYARNNYKSIVEREEAKKLDERGRMVMGDSAHRLAMLTRKVGNLEEAETLLKKALELREENKRVMAMNPGSIALTIVQLAAIQEERGNVSEEVEANLMRALEIFTRTRGQASMEVRNTLAQIQNVRKKRIGGGSGGGGGLLSPTGKGGSPLRPGSRVKPVTMAEDVDDEEDDDDGLVYTVKDESKPKRSPASLGGGGGASPTYNPDEELKKLKLPEGDAVARMMHANTFFQAGKYNCAEVVLSEAFEIFLAQNGPDHPTTKTAFQNLSIARDNALKKLWMQVTTEIALSNAENGKYIV